MAFCPEHTTAFCEATSVGAKCRMKNSVVLKGDAHSSFPVSKSTQKTLLLSM